MKQIICSAVVATALFTITSTQVFADHNGYGNSLFTKENIGRAVGTGLGAYLGSKVGKGRGNDAAIAAGAVGGFVLGGKVGRDWNGHRRGHGYAHSSHSHGTHSHRKRTKSKRGYLEPVQAMPELEYIDSIFQANRTSNVRGGPSTKYKVVEGLHHGEQVHVLGRVVEKNWYMIAQNDIIQGFVHMSLLDPVGQYYSYGNN